MKAGALRTRPLVRTPSRVRMAWSGLRAPECAEVMPHIILEAAPPLRAAAPLHVEPCGRGHAPQDKRVEIGSYPSRCNARDIQQICFGRLLSEGRDPYPGLLSRDRASMLYLRPTDPRRLVLLSTVNVKLVLLKALNVKRFLTLRILTLVSA